MLPRSTWSRALILSFFWVAAASSARADEAADTAAARLLANDGLDLAEAGNCQQAIEKLRRAEELHHAPTTATRLGECEIAVGRVVAGTERLQRLLREPVGAGAPAPFLDALARARSALERSLPHVPTMRIDVRAPPGTKLQVTVDGEPLPDALIGNERPTDPGHHTIEATATGFLPARRHLNLGDGETARVALDLIPAPTPTDPTPPNARAEPRQGVRSHSSSTSSAGAVVALTISGIGLVAGIIGGTTVAVDSNDLSKSCNANKECPADKQSELTAAKTWATVSTVGFATAGVGLATGLLLLLTRKHESEPAVEARLSPVLGPLYVGCAGSF
jgi:hypothetical protein